MYATTLPRSNWLRRASIRLASYRHMPASSLDMHQLAFVINFQIHFVSLITRFNLPPHAFVNPSLSPSPLSSSITPSLFQYRLKTYLFNKSFPPQIDFFYLLDCLHDDGTGPYISQSSVYFQFVILIFCSFRVVD